MHKLETVIFSRGTFTKNEHDVEFVDMIENGVDGQYVVLVSREDEDDAGYRALFAQIHFVAQLGEKFLAMAIPVVESFEGIADSEDAEVYCLRQELSGEVEELTLYANIHGRRAEFDSNIPLTDESWDEFRAWVDTLRPKRQHAV